MSEIVTPIVIYAAVGFITVIAFALYDVDEINLAAELCFFLLWPIFWMMALIAGPVFIAHWIGIRIRQAFLNARKKPHDQ